MQRGSIVAGGKTPWSAFVGIVEGIEGFALLLALPVDD